MVDLLQLKPGNWLTYIRENRYCTFVSSGDYTIVAGFNGQWNCFPEDLTYVTNTVHVFSLAGFKMNGNQYSKTTGEGQLLTISYSDYGPYLCIKDGEAIKIPHVHSLQNAYLFFTGEELSLTLYGAPS